MAWVKNVPDPRRFGVVESNKDGWISRLIEKPVTIENKQVAVGCYYFRHGEALVSAIEEQMEQKNSLKGEFFLADAINIMVERGLKMRAQTIDVWLDVGTIESILGTNRYLLSHGHDNTTSLRRDNVRIVAPVFIDESASIDNSTIGPYASIGADCKISNSRVEDSILESGVVVDAAALKNSFVGRQARVQGCSAESTPMVVNIGDNSTIEIT